MSRHKKPGLPKRLFKRPMPDIPPEIDKIRDAHKVIDPHQIYRMKLPDGSTLESTGAYLIATSDAFVALADAQRAGNERGISKAIERIDHLS